MAKACNGIQAGALVIDGGHRGCTYSVGKGTEIMVFPLRPDAWKPRVSDPSLLGEPHAIHFDGIGAPTTAAFYLARSAGTVTFPDYDVTVVVY